MVDVVCVPNNQQQHHLENKPSWCWFWPISWREKVNKHFSGGQRGQLPVAPNCASIFAILLSFLVVDLSKNQPPGQQHLKSFSDDQRLGLDRTKAVSVEKDCDLGTSLWSQHWVICTCFTAMMHLFWACFSLKHWTAPRSFCVGLAAFVDNVQALLVLCKGGLCFSVLQTNLGERTWGWSQNLLQNGRENLKKSSGGWTNDLWIWFLVMICYGCGFDMLQAFQGLLLLLEVGFQLPTLPSK